MKQPEKKGSPLAFLVIILFFVAPPLGFLAAIVLAAYNQSKKNAAAQGRPTPAAKPRPVRTKTGPVQEKGRPNVTHVHTPQAYSYDGCAKEKRLEQLETLKNAGLLEDVEHQQRRQAILGRP